jgi:23S rRNA (guanosine2251-2'-O)-methyltransferase
MSSDRRKPDGRTGSGDHTWSYGSKPVFDLATNKPDRIVKLYRVEPNKDSISQGRTLLPTEKVQVVSKQDFLKLFPGIHEINHQWVCAKIHPATSVTISQLINKSKRQGRGLLIGLDQVQDPANLGSIFRTADALGADGLFFTKNSSASVTNAVRRISVGATEFLPFSEVTNLANALIELKKEGFWIFGTSLSESSLDIEETEMIFPLVLLFGSEGEGLRQRTETLCDRLVHVRKYGMVESMNVGCSVSSVLFYARTKLNK